MIQNSPEFTLQRVFPAAPAPTISPPPPQFAKIPFMGESTSYPLFLNLRRQHVLIVGGGSVALRKTHGLLDAQARITLISPDFHPELSSMKKVIKRRATYAPADMARRPWRLVFAATDNRTVNAQVAKDAKAARILCSRCDDPKHSDFACGSTARVGNITIAISTDGASPALASRVREQVVSAIDPMLAQLTELHRDWRAKIQHEIPSIAVRAKLLKQLAGEEMENHFRRQGPTGAQTLFKKWLASALAVGKKATQKATHAK